jgi:hypothetical protein
LRRRSPPDAKILLGLWPGVPHALEERPETPDAIDDIATSLSEAVEHIAERLSADTASSPSIRGAAYRTAKASSAG